MFGVDHQTMKSATSPGRAVMRDYDLILKEYGRNQIYNPFRFLMFWNKEVRLGKATSANIAKSQQDLLNKYRSEKSPAEIEKDQSILGHLVRSPYASDKERCADMTILMIAGHDTSSYTLAWIFLEISRHPAVLTQLKREIDSVVGNDEGHITQHHLNNMLYMDQVIKEGMRLWPVAALVVLRQNSKDIEYADFVIPKGSICQLCFYVSNRVGIKVGLYQPHRPSISQNIMCSLFAVATTLFPLSRLHLFTVLHFTLLSYLNHYISTPGLFCHPRSHHHSLCALSLAYPTPFSSSLLHHHSKPPHLHSLLLCSHI